MSDTRSPFSSTQVYDDGEWPRRVGGPCIHCGKGYDDHCRDNLECPIVGTGLPPAFTDRREPMDENETTQFAPDAAESPEVRRTRALSRLRQATWEATQFLETDELVIEYVKAVLRDVGSDAE